MTERSDAGPVLLTHRFFWPDTAPYGIILRKLALHLDEQDRRDVHILTTRPSYRPGISAPDRERLGRGVHVRRVWAAPELSASIPIRMLNALYYCSALLAEIVRLRPAVVTASSFPPILAGWCAAIGARIVGARFVYHVQDIHPDISELRSNGPSPVTRLLRRLDTFTLGSASAIVVPGHDMAATLRARPGLRDGSAVHVIPNCSLEEDVDPDGDIPPELQRPRGARRIIFAGNLGRFQDLERVVEGIVGALPAFPDTHLLLLGDGALRGELESRWGTHPQVRFHPLVDASLAARVIGNSDAAVLPLAPGIYRVAYPSKLAAYASVGTPVLASVDPGSDLAVTIRDQKLGHAVADPTSASFRVGITALFSEDRDRQREACRSWYARVASEARMLAAWDEVLRRSAVHS